MKHLIIRLTGLLSILVLAAVTMVGSWSADNFFYQPSLGARGPVEKVHFDSGLNRADTPLGDPNYSNLSEVLNTIGTETEITLTISAGTVPVTTNTFIPANIGLRILKGGKFNISGGKILTINGPIEAGRYQIFSCSGRGAVSFAANGRVSAVYPEWWGAQAEWGGSTGTDDEAEIEAACATHTVVNLGDKQYAVGGSIDINSEVTFISNGAEIQRISEAGR